jgi:serine/threonine protein kinase
MYEKVIGTGSCSIILGPHYYGSFMKPEKNKLLKITLIIPNHNEFRNMRRVKQIANYQDYYAIPEEEGTFLKPNDMFYEYLKRLIDTKNMEMFMYNNMLSCHYVEYAGHKDVFDSYQDLLDDRIDNIWKSYRVIMSFIKKISHAIDNLHKHQIAHLDIKPENIMVNIKTNTFKLIDFGFCDVFPFNNFLSDIRGTPGYFPKHYTGIKYDSMLPRIEANDFSISEDNCYPHFDNRRLVYKIDCYCFGRTLHMLKQLYDDHKIYYCCNFEKSVGESIDRIIADLVENDVHKRITIRQLIDKYNL